MSDEVLKAATEALRQLALLKFALAFDAEEKVRLMNERAIRAVVEDRNINVHSLKPLSSGGEPMRTEAVTVPLGPPRDIAAIDAVAQGFADRERLAAIAEQLEVARKLKGL
jgi:hypothetical protein